MVLRTPIKHSRVLGSPEAKSLGSQGYWSLAEGFQGLGARVHEAEQKKYYFVAFEEEDQALLFTALESL